MTRRDILPAGDTAAHRAWIAAALVAVFQTPRRMPSLRMPKGAAIPDEPLPDLFRDILDALDAPTQPEAPQLVGMSPGELLRSHFGDALPGPSALTVKRRELKRQRADASLQKAPGPVANAYLVEIGLPMLEDLRETRGQEADAALEALNAKRPPEVLKAVRIMMIRRFELHSGLRLYLKLANGADVGVTVRWSGFDCTYEWTDIGATQSRTRRYAWFKDEGAWFSP